MLGMPRRVVEVFVEGDVSILEELGMEEVLSVSRVFMDWYRLEVEVDGDGEEWRKRLQEIVNKLKSLGLRPAQSPNYY